MKKLNLSITEFALPCPRVGSIESHSGYGRLPEVGTLIHQEIQRERQQQDPGYIPERWVSYEIPADKYVIAISGRMDGYRPGLPAWIEEIKSSYSVDQLQSLLRSQSDHPYRRQLLTYGYIHFKQMGSLPRLTLSLVCSRTKKITPLEIDLDVIEFEAWMHARANEIVREQQEFEAAMHRRKKMATAVRFPFPAPREGQAELMEFLKERLKNKSRLILQAPTGLGKTAGILVPSLTEAFHRGQKLIYVTPKNSQHQVAEDAVERLQAETPEIRAITVIAKSKMCLKDQVLCNPEYCEFAKDHYTKVAERGLAEKLRQSPRLNEDTLKDLGREHEVCPFELQLEAAPYADVIIGDYNYVFSPRNIKSRLLQNGYGKSTALANLVIDEAHNLPSRAADYFSAQLSLAELTPLVEGLPLASDLRPLAEEIIRRLSELMNHYDQSDLAGRARGRVIDLNAETFAEIEALGHQLMAGYLGSNAMLVQDDAIPRIANAVTEFALALQNMNEDFFCSHSEWRGAGQFKITCCDASFWLKGAYADFAHVVAFSATLKPFDFYERLLGLEDQLTASAEFASPFPPAHRKLMIIPQISTKWRDRQNQLPKIRSVIERVLALRPGNYFVFFPSFEFMRQAYESIQLPDFEVLCQKRDMSRREIAEIIDHLHQAQTPTVVFAVQGGVFAEGVDYPGEALIGALVVGPALPTFDFEREQIREYFERKYGAGFDYAYVYPAMARTIQSAGRVIRSNNDRGVILLLDRRFVHETYRRAMPKDWLAQGFESLLSQKILADIESFWRRNDFRE